MEHSNHGEENSTRACVDVMSEEGRPHEGVGTHCYARSNKMVLPYAVFPGAPALLMSEVFPDKVASAIEA